MAAPVSQHQSHMPGSFEPMDYIDSHSMDYFDGQSDYVDAQSTLYIEDHPNVWDDPFERLTTQQDNWREREPPAPWATFHLADLDPESVEWRTYEPPACLKSIPDAVPDVLRDIIISSVEAVRKQAEIDHQQLQEEEERKKAAEVEARGAEKRKKQVDEHYLPIIIPEHDPEGGNNEVSVEALGLLDSAESGKDVKGKGKATSSSSPPPSSSGASSPEPDLVLPPIKGIRSRLAVLDKLFARSRRSGESSSAGYTREALKKQFLISSPVPGSFSHGGAAASQLASLTKIMPEPLVQEQTPVECVSCLDEFPEASMVKVPCHSYCADCFVALISNAVQNEQQWPPKCCLNAIPAQTILRFVPEDLKNTFREKASEWEIPVSERVYCYRAGCGLWVKPTQIKKSKRKGKCDAGHWTCVLCRAKHHGSAECPQDPEMNLTNALAEEEGWKRCYKCQAYVEHREACQHMTCRCGAQFCYVCGSRWRTCDCTLEQLNMIKNRADERREQRQMKESAESEELRLILAQIEQFEREEALKAEIARQEEERLEQERQERELQQRAWEEYTRRNAVDKKFSGYCQDLQGLHDAQLAMVKTQQELDTLNLCRYGQGNQEQLTLKQEYERAELDSRIRDKIARKEKRFEQDFDSRAGEEMKIMKEYEERLRAYWARKPNSHAEIAKAIKPLKAKFESGCKAWRRWKDDQLGEYKDRLEEDRSIREELMGHALRRLEEKREADELDLVRRGVAEMIWLRIVSIEREKMLQLMEAEEMEGDADSLFAGDSSATDAYTNVQARASDSALVPQEGVGIATSCEPTTVGVAM